MAVAIDPYYWTKDLQDIQAQREATGAAKPFTPGQLSQLVEANFRAQQEEQESSRRLAIQESAEQRAARAERRQAITGAVSGIVGTGLMLPTAIKGYQDIGWLEKPAAAPGTVSPATAAISTPATTADIGMSATDIQALGTSSAAQPAITGATTETGSAATGAGGAGIGGAAITGGAIIGGEYLGRRMVHGKYSQAAGIFGSTASGATAGALIGAGAGGVGALPGALIGGAAGLTYGVAKAVFGNSIICTELNRQGLLSDSMARASSLYVAKHVSNDVYAGYIKFAGPIVWLMKRSKIVTYAMLPYGRLLSRECASRVNNKYKSTFMSRMAYGISIKLFSIIGKKRMEVCNA